MTAPSSTPAAPTPATSATKLAQDPYAEIVSRLNSYGEIASEWVRLHWFELSIAAAIATLSYFMLRLLKRKAAALAEKTENRSSLQSIALRTLGKTSRFFRLMLSVQLVGSLANTPAPIARAITIAFTISVVWQAAIWLREIILGLLERRVADSDASTETLSNAMVLIRVLVSGALFSIAAIVMLDNLGFNVTGLIAGLGVGGIAIGLAAQGIFSDLFAAISIILDKPFKVGDMISYDTSVASVEKIGMKSTRLRSVTGELLIISNSKLLEMQITNITSTGYRRTRYAIGLVYQTTPEKARALPALLQKIVEAEGAEFVRAGFIGFGASTINFDLTFDIVSEDFEHIITVRHHVGIAIIEAFKAQGYEFAYPTQTTFTAGPDGTMVMPYAGIPAPAQPTPQKRSVSPKK
jgi:small-conductance mechanosensitive channel